MKACFTEFTTFIYLCNRTTAVKHCQKMAVLHLRTSSELSKAFLTKNQSQASLPESTFFDNGPTFVRPVKLFFLLLYKCIHLSLSRVYTMLDISYLWELTCQQKKSLAYKCSGHKYAQKLPGHEVTQYTGEEKGVGIKREHFYSFSQVKIVLLFAIWSTFGTSLISVITLQTSTCAKKSKAIIFSLFLVSISSISPGCSTKEI